MSLNWAIGVSDNNPRNIEIITGTGQRTAVDIEAAVQAGIPHAQQSKRLLYEGDFSSWQVGSAAAYLAGLGLELPSTHANRHDVLMLETDKGITVHVPALVLMSAFFKPNRLVFPAVFSPAGINLLSFVDYAATPPTVVIDNIGRSMDLFEPAKGVTQARAIEWLQLSKSARKTSQSAYQSALVSWLRVSLPLGRVRIVFHGALHGKQLYATKATLVSVVVPAGDSVTGVSEEIVFHAMIDAGRKPTASIRELTVPLRPDGGSTVTHAEWDRIEPMLRRRIARSAVHCQRELLDIILHKLTSGLSWKKVPKGDLAVTDLTSTFRRWSTTGRLKDVLAYLKIAREHTAAASEGPEVDAV